MAGTLPFLGTYVVLSLWILRFIVVFRHRLSCMVGMMAAMTLGMTVGLGIGTLAATWLPGQFFQATMLSMLIAGLIGAIAGMPISIMAVLDGLLAGIMGGMMGAMLIVMVPSIYTGSTIKIMIVLCSGIIFLLFLMLQGEIKSEHLKQRSFMLSKPVSMFTAIGVFLIMIHQTAGISAVQSEDHSAHSQITQVDKLSSSSDLTVKTNKELLVKATEFSFTPSSIYLSANEKIIITLDNTGEVEHDFEIIGTDIHVHAGPGKKSTTISSIEKAGSYKAVCTLPGHKEAGMISVIKVSS